MLVVPTIVEGTGSRMRLSFSHMRLHFRSPPYDPGMAGPSSLLDRSRQVHSVSQPAVWWCHW